MTITTDADAREMLEGLTGIRVATSEGICANAKYVSKVDDYHALSVYLMRRLEQEKARAEAAESLVDHLRADKDVSGRDMPLAQFLVEVRTQAEVERDAARYRWARRNLLLDKSEQEFDELCDQGIAIRTQDAAIQRDAGKGES